MDMGGVPARVGRRVGDGRSVEQLVFARRPVDVASGVATGLALHSLPMDRSKLPLDRPISFEDAARLDPDEQPADLVAGRLVPVTKNTLRHGRILIKVGTVLEEFASRNPGWYVVGGDAGCKLAHDPDTLRGPDVAILREDRVPAGRGAEGWLEGGPEVAVEIVGDGQSVAQLVKKALEYLRAGSKAVWVLDPDERSVVVITSGASLRLIEHDGTLDGGDALPGFSCTVSRFFP